MKKIILILTFFVFPIITQAVDWDSCNIKDDPYPGDCNAYIDTDKDGVCDYSQPAPEDRNILE